jgi:anti-sigma B factor antagonist
MINIIKETEGHLLIDVDISEANLDNSAAFKSEVVALLDKHRKTVIIDLGKIEYIDSSFLGALVAVLKHALAAKLDIKLINLKKDVYDLLLLIRLDRVFKIYNSYNEAI